jgi:hypothetical protein
MCSRNTSGYIEPAPIKPKPPALLTALVVYNHYSKSFRLDNWIFNLKSVVILFMNKLNYDFLIIFSFFENHPFPKYKKYNPSCNDFKEIAVSGVILCSNTFCPKIE